MKCPFIHPYAYSILIQLFTIITATVFILLLLLLFFYCYCYKTVTTDKLLRASLFPGAAELTTHLLRLINIRWLPLCRINKFGFTFLEDCCDPLYLWVITPRLYWQRANHRPEEGAWDPWRWRPRQRCWRCGTPPLSPAGAACCGS
jgi:hypothetical protein